MRLLTPTQVHELKVAELGLDPTMVDLTTVEALAGALRRAAGFSCPCSAAMLARTVWEPLRGLVSDLDATKGQIEETLDAMIAHGDLLESEDVLAEPSARGAALLYLAPPSFVARQSGALILLGIIPDQRSALPADLERRVEYSHHVRRLRPTNGEALATVLTEFGLVPITSEAWLRAPRPETATQHLQALDDRLSAAQPSRDVPGLLLLDSAKSVHYYRGRWAQPKAQSGRFVARRSQAYGADLWCYVEMSNGNPLRLLDFPVDASRWRGCDEAWRLQLAVDASRGVPQVYRLQPLPDGKTLLQLFSPVPMWAQRRWDAIGDPTPSAGCLFAYVFRTEDFDAEQQFLRDALWLEPVTTTP